MRDLCKVVLAVALVAPAGAPGQDSTIGADFLINTYTVDNQDYPAVCRDAAGDFVVVWESYAQDGYGNGVFAQRFTSAAVPVGTEFQVNTHTGGEQGDPTVCCAPDGRFVVAWQSFPQESDYGVFAQRYTSAGTRAGTEFQVNSYTGGSQLYPSACCAADGSFVVAWHSQGQDDDGSGGIFAQRYTSAGTALDDEFQVNSYTTGSQTRPALCCDGSGSFVVTWQGLPGQDGDLWGVFGRRFSSTGEAQGGDFQVNTYTTGTQYKPEVCCGASGDFVVTWESSGQDGEDEGVFAQRYTSTTALLGTEFQVNAYTAGIQHEPAICCDASGNFVVAWESYDGGGEGSFARRFSSTGAPLSGEFLVNTYTTFSQGNPAIACAPEAGFLMVWQSFDGHGQGVFGQRPGALEPPPVPGAVGAPALSPVNLGALALALLGLGAGFAARRRRKS